MKTLDPQYDPSGSEKAIYEKWVSEGYFGSSPEPEKDGYCIVIPPPNVTGALHMGHALNNSIQDILIRWRRMQGRETLWLPGTDHAGIATQNVVEKQLATEGKSRHDLGREKFVRKVWEWREQYGDRIIDQLKRLGCSCDWSRQRFTLDEGLSKAVRTVFVALYNEGKLYRGHYIINWCPKCLTALSDDEVEHKSQPGKLWHMRYPIVGEEGYVVVATTRPETMLGDTGVAVNPKDPRYKSFVGKSVRLPFVDRDIPIVADEAVDMEFGTGCVKITPAHDHNDYQIGKRHDLEELNVMTDEAVINSNGGPFEGMDRMECRKELVKRLEDMDLLEKTEDYELNLSVCYRCDTAIEPRLSEQWFVRMRELAQPAIEAAKSGRVKFHPQRWSKVYYDWLENVRDWCISRQLWWGHPIPVWYCQDCGRTIVAVETPTECPDCANENLEPDPDVLDTWFSSALWPFSTLGWPEETEDLNATTYPTDTLVTARDIIYFWVARMVMMGEKFMGKEPFSHVLIHGTILDEIGRRMSKSLGNGIDPIEMIDIYGADAVRFSLINLTIEGQDVKLSPKKFEMGRNFTNKIWNATRFALMKMPAELDTSGPLDMDELTVYDRWILTRLSETIETVTAEQEDFRLNPAVSEIYSFFWNDLCDWYLESIKQDLSDDAPASRRQNAARVFLAVLDSALRLLHPYMPYITEELWQYLNRYFPARTLGEARNPSESIMIARWPEATDFPRFGEDVERMEMVKKAVSAVRNLRGTRDIKQRKELSALFDPSSEANASVLKSQLPLISRLGNLKSIDVKVGISAPDHSATELVPHLTLYVPLGEVVDLEQERARLQKKLDEQTRYIMGVEMKLSNKQFVNKAPQQVVERERERLARLRELEGKIRMTLLQMV
ncbi:MAG: valine--tRNA ligase [Planctomycetota bacterium]|nr:valine--tRNA ligase [Planctomycetota bacterium]